MIIPILMLAAAQTVTAAPPAPPARLGRPFMSPMGEPVFGRQPGEDGLVAWFMRADTNHDGFLTAEEMAADAERFFKELDVDHDGEIGPEEIERYETQIAPQVRVRAAMNDMSAATPGDKGRRPGSWRDSKGAGADSEAGAGRYGLLQIPEPVMSADTNFNRGVSEDEFRAAALARFQLLDTNHTGRLTLPQLQAIRQSAIAAANRGDQKKPEAGEITQDSGAAADSSGVPTNPY